MKTRRAGKAVLLCAVMVWTQAFSCATAIQELQTWAPTVVGAFSGVVSIINPAAGIGLELADLAITKLFAPGGPIFSGITAYQASPTNGTALNNLVNALNAANAQFETALQDIPANPNSNDVKAAQAAILLLATTLEAFEARLAPAPPASAAAHAQRAVAYGVTPAKNKADFIKKYNAIMVANGHSERILK